MDTDNIASTHLGKRSLGSEVYDPSLLVAVPREENRKQYGIMTAKESGKLKVESGKFSSEDRRAGGQEGKPIESGKLKVESGKLKSTPTLPSPLGRVSEGQEGLIEEQKISGLEDKLFNDSHAGASNDAPYFTNFQLSTLNSQLNNSHTSISPYLHPSNSPHPSPPHPGREQDFSQTNPSTDMPPHPSPLPQGEGVCDDSPSTLQPFNPSTDTDSSQFTVHGLPFEGFDIWHAYEFSCMTENGIPVTRLMKMIYPCNNEFLVESKSLKLYLNSFNMMKFGKNTEECLSICKKMIEKDLSELLKTTVEINFLDNNAEQVKIFADFENIMNFVDETTLQITNFKESPEILQTEQTEDEKEYKLTFDSLRSNCRVTHQPDFGDVFIYYRSKKHIKEDSLVKYLTSFRSEYHFHEECCEMVFKRLSDILDEEDELMVCALYTRRGGIDICPIRWKLEGWRAESGKLKVESGKLKSTPTLPSPLGRVSEGQEGVIEEQKISGLEDKLFNDSSLSDFSKQPQTDNDLFAYSPIRLFTNTIQSSINSLLNTQTLARNGIKQ